MKFEEYYIQYVTYCVRHDQSFSSEYYEIELDSSDKSLILTSLASIFCFYLDNHVSFFRSNQGPLVTPIKLLHHKTAPLASLDWVSIDLFLLFRIRFDPIGEQTFDLTQWYIAFDRYRTELTYTTCDFQSLKFINHDRIS